MTTVIPTPLLPHLLFTPFLKILLQNKFKKFHEKRQGLKLRCTFLFRLGPDNGNQKGFYLAYIYNLFKYFTILNSGSFLTGALLPSSSTGTIEKKLYNNLENKVPSDTYLQDQPLYIEF